MLLIRPIALLSPDKSWKIKQLYTRVKYTYSVYNLGNIIFFSNSSIRIRTRCLQNTPDIMIADWKPVLKSVGPGISAFIASFWSVNENRELVQGHSDLVYLKIRSVTAVEYGKKYITERYLAIYIWLLGLYELLRHIDRNKAWKPRNITIIWRSEEFIPAICTHRTYL